jgi:ABC-2 type transport system ATP-binding protein
MREHSMSDAYAIETVDLCKTYDRGVDALRGLTLRVPRGSIFGFLGKNGAGKTTTIKVLLGMAYATSGDARVFGLPAGVQHSSVSIRRRTAFVSEDRDLYDSMTVDQIVRFTAGFYPKWNHESEKRYRRQFELPSDRAIKTLSRGMRTKLDLLLALSRGAELLVLDEPTAGLDPAAAEDVLQALVAHVGAEEVTVFLSTHHLSDVDQIADTIAIIDRGRTVLSGRLDDVRDQYRRIQWVFDGDAPEPAFQTAGIVRVQRRGRVLTALVNGVVDAIVEEVRPLRPASVETLPVTLKEIFLETVATEN